MSKSFCDFAKLLLTFLHYNPPVHSIDHHILASLSIAGTCLDVLGTLFLAYGLLGGQNGPLRLISRMVMYSLVFGTGYALGLGLFFGIVAGVTSGVTISVELHRKARHGDNYPLWVEGIFSLVRAAGFAAGAYRVVGLRFAVAFGALIAAGQVVAYCRGMRPGMDYVAARRPRFTARQAVGTLARTVGYTAAALICGIFLQHLEHPWQFALRVGLVTGVVTAIGISFNPYVEYYADRLPERTLGSVGIALILCGFGLQSVQYWVSLLDVRIR
jgi:hypothetical protein